MAASTADRSPFLCTDLLCPPAVLYLHQAGGTSYFPPQPHSCFPLSHVCFDSTGRKAGTVLDRVRINRFTSEHCCCTWQRAHKQHPSLHGLCALSLSILLSTCIKSSLKQGFGLVCCLSCRPHEYVHFIELNYRARRLERAVLH